MTGVLCIGFAAQDHVFGVERFPTSAEKHRAHTIEIVGGGIAANAAVTVARLGGRAMLATRLGDDSIGRDILDALAAERVDCSLTKRFPGLRSPASAILVDRAGERMVVSYSDPSTPDEADWLPDRLPRDVSVVLADTRWESGALKLFTAARAASAPGVLDGDRAPKNSDILSAASHLIFSRQAAREMTGRDDPVDALRDFPAPDDVTLAITDGPRGVYVRSGSRAQHIPSFDVTAVDTLAAGDVFHGAFAFALSELMPEDEAWRFAAATAAIKCTRFGGRAGAPTRAEVEAFLAERSR